MTVSVILVDPCDASLLTAYEWSILPTRNTSYAYAWVDGKTIYLHRLIMGDPAGMEVHHENGNGLDCRRANLAIVTHKKNPVLQRRKRRPRSGYQGVILRESGKYQARSMVDGRWRYLGTFETAEQASMAYQDFVKARVAELR